jgi:hypothetical protein
MLGRVVGDLSRILGLNVDYHETRIWRIREVNYALISLREN